MPALMDPIIVKLPRGDNALVYRMYDAAGDEAGEWPDASHLIAETDEGKFVGVPVADVTLVE